MNRTWFRAILGRGLALKSISSICSLGQELRDILLVGAVYGEIMLVNRVKKSRNTVVHK